MAICSCHGQKNVESLQLGHNATDVTNPYKKSESLYRTLSIVSKIFVITKGRNAWLLRCRNEHSCPYSIFLVFAMGLRTC
jgi:hypothetical protein